MWERLRNSGLSKQQAAGVLGNMYQESHFNPKASAQGKFHGLLQLSNPLWANYQTYLNGRENTVDTQLDYLLPILTTRDNANPHNILGQNIYQNE